HGFSSRLGGVSQGGAASLNLALRMADPPQNVRENYRIFSRELGFDYTKLVFSQQTHTTNIRVATTADAGKGICRERDYRDIDGLITQEPQLPLITHHADCASLFFYEPQAQLIGVAHAGWRGTIHNIAAAMVEKLTTLGGRPERLIAAVGPCAGPCCYQVGAEVADQFAPLADEQGSMCRPALEKGKFLIDIPRTNRLLLLQAGVSAAKISLSGLCTICHNDIFYSHRCQGLDRGAMGAVMMMTHKR
ncbi:MAG: peptidoglycan editing factor PgeF, partial [Clostridiales bacterium]